MQDLTEAKKQKLDHLQSIISRVEGNTFNIKSLCITIISAAIAFAATNATAATIVLTAAIFVVVIFWSLDANYLRTGRKLRKVYEETAPIDIGLSLSNGAPAKFIPTFFSWSVGWFYIAVIALVLATLAYLNSTDVCGSINGK